MAFAVRRQPKQKPRQMGWGILAGWALSLAIHCAVVAALWSNAGSLFQESTQGPHGSKGTVLEGAFYDASAASANLAEARAPSFESSFTVRATFNPLPESKAPLLLAGYEKPVQALPPTASQFPLSAVPAPSDSTKGGSTNQPRNPQGSGRGEAQLFGLSGTGRRFVYVIDCSASMSAYQSRPFLAAKRELIASLQALESSHQFQVIFYNDSPIIMTMGGSRSPQMVVANERGKRLAEQFIGGIFADGSARHLEALRLALSLRPDAIFFLTDAKPPQLTPQELRQVQLLNKTTAINTIEFGAGPPIGQDNFLVQLAFQNSGRHTYVDVTRLSH
jgi:hypothetical protein